MSVVVFPGMGIYVAVDEVVDGSVIVAVVVLDPVGGTGSYD
jgi:hypothetical protein